MFLFSAVNHTDKVAEGIVGLKCERAQLYREMNTPVRWNPLPIVVRSGFAFRRVIRSASGTLFLSVRKDEERNRKILPLHSSNSRRNYRYHSLLRTVGASLRSFRGCCGVALIPVVFIKSPVVAVAFKSHRRNTCELLMTPIAERYARKEPSKIMAPPLAGTK